MVKYWMIWMVNYRRIVLYFFPSFGGDWCSLDAEFYWVDCSSDGSKERMFRVGTALQSQMLSGEITGHSEDKWICCRLTSKECWCMVEMHCAGNPRWNHPEQCHHFEKTHRDQILMSIQIYTVYIYIYIHMYIYQTHSRLDFKPHLYRYHDIMVLVISTPPLQPKNRWVPTRSPQWVRLRMQDDQRRARRRAPTFGHCLLPSRWWNGSFWGAGDGSRGFSWGA